MWREWDNVSRGHYPAVLHWPSWSWEQLHCHCGTYQWGRSRWTKGIFCTIYSNHFFTQRWVGRFNITIEYFPRNIFTWRKNKYLSWYSLNNKITIVETYYLLKFVALSTKTSSSTDESQLQISDTGNSTSQYTLLRQEIMLHSVMCYHNNAFSIANSTDSSRNSYCNHNSVHKLLLYL